MNLPLEVSMSTHKVNLDALIKREDFEGGGDLPSIISTS